MPSLTEVREHLTSLQYQANQIATEAGVGGGDIDFSRVKCIPGTTQDKFERWKAINLEMTEVGAEYDRLKLVEAEMKAAAREWAIDSQPVNTPLHAGTNGLGLRVPTNNISKLIDASTEWRALKERKQGTARIEIPDFKALIQLSGVSPQNDRVAPVPFQQETRTVIDVIGETQVSAATTVEWYENTTFTNVAREEAEGAAKQEATLEWTLRNSPIRTIAVWIPVTVQALDDNDFLEGEIRNSLSLMVQRREEVQVLVGDGNGENISGILDNANIQTEAKGANPTPTAIFNALQKVRGSAGAGFGEPDLIVMHPADLTQMYTLQSLQGDYILQAVIQNSPDFRLWGLPIRQTTAMTEGTALVGDFATGAEVYRRGGLSVAASTEHSTYFTENKVAIRAESRIGLAVRVPAYFCEVTGI